MMTSLFGRRLGIRLHLEMAARMSNSSPARHAVAVPPYRQIHASSLSQLATSNDAGENNKATGFRAFMNRQNNHNHDRSNIGKPSPRDNVQEASTFMNTHDDPEEDWLNDVGIIPDLGAKNSATSEYDFGEHYENDLHEWHERKKVEFHQLSSNTDKVLESINENKGNIDAIISQMQEWDSFLSSFTPELYSLSEFRSKNPNYPPSAFMQTMTYDAAEKVESLLAQLLEGGTHLTPEIEVNAYKLAMRSWSQVFHSLSGDRCENILELYGEKYGGDMNYMPTLDSYNTVQKAHLKSCSSFLVSNEGVPPGIKALGVLTLLTNVSLQGDMFLKPDIELYSHTIAVVRSTLFDGRHRRRFPENWSLEKELVRGLLDSLNQMESSLGELLKNKSKDERNQLSLQEWNYAIRAYSDGLATVASIPMRDNDITTKSLLVKLENFLTTNSTNIVLSIADNNLTDTDVKELLGEIQRHVEESYTSAIFVGSILSDLPDFKSAVDITMSSEEILQRMKQLSQESTADTSFLFPLPTYQNYRALIKCWNECLRQRYSTPEANEIMAKMKTLPHLRAQSLLEELEMQQEAGSIEGSIYIDMIGIWTQTLSWPAVYSKNDYYYAANAVDKLLKRAMSGYDKGSVTFETGAVTEMYNRCFRLHSRILKGGEKAMDQTLNLFDHMQDQFTRSDGAVAKPDKFTFGLIMKTIANSGSKSSASHAAAMLQKMESLGMKPSEKHYLGLIRAYSRVGQRHVSDPTKAEKVLQHVKEKYKADKSVKPTTAMYSACISAYGGSKTHNSVSKVLELFEELQELYNETNDEAFLPDSMLYSDIIKAVSKARSKDDFSVRKAMELLNEMETSHDSGKISEGPNRYAYTNMLHALSQSRIKNGVSMAEELMHRMDKRSRELDDKSILPDTHAYTTVIQLLSRSRQPDAVQRAQRWFQEMEKRHEEGESESKPNRVTCTALINCWRLSGREEAGEEAEKIISMMETKYEEGDFKLKPDAFVYASAMDAWARSNSRDKAVRVWNLYQSMKAQYMNGNMECKPNDVIMTSIIKACGYTRGGREDKQKALKILLECMSEMKIPTPIIYRTSLNALQALVADDSKRRPITATIFEACCRSGHLDETVLETLEKVQPELFLKLPGEIPSKWKRNVRA